LRRYRRDGDVAARDELVRRFTPLAQSLVARYDGRGEIGEDLQQVGALALIKAIDRYDPDVGPFVPFAVPTILGEIRRYFRDQTWDLRVPRSVQESYLKVHRAIEELTAVNGSAPHARDVAAFTGLDETQVAAALEAGHAHTVSSLEEPRSLLDDDGGALTLGDTLGSDDPRLGDAELRQALVPALGELPERQRRIVYLRVVEDLTQSQIAARVGISQMHVSRLLSRSFESLREAVA
jgi:RNA polymerase sigma-B factor